MQFESPIFLVLLILLPILFLYLRYNKNTRTSAIRFGEIGSFRQLHKTLGSKALPVLNVTRFLIVVLLILTLARPQLLQSQVRRFPEGVDIILALDVSESMRAEDFEDGNRLQTSKIVIRDFLNNRVSDRIGLVIFSGESFTLCPLTLDYSIVIQLLEDVEVSMGGRLQDGTAIGDAIATTINRLRISDSKTKIVILLTDGENNAGTIDPSTAASLAQSFGVKIYTIGMGKEEGALIPYEDTTLGRRYREVLTYLDEDTLKMIANITGTQYFRATDVQTLKHIYDEIDQLEKTKYKVVEYTNHKEMVAYFLLPATILLGLEILLSNTVLRKIP